MMGFPHEPRHVDVAILYGLGQKDRAQHIARSLRPIEVGLPEFERERHGVTINDGGNNMVESINSSGERSD